ncbi:MAG: acetoacetate decarboxylase family protein [Kamptonema sp. SIO1D9]|nr:acetoacetate decarboxylase family protein [Kamptonema sp. SIO1D9]
MTYPTAPWQLKGYALANLQLIDVAKARPLIPDNFEIISILPGKTLGGVYISNYSGDSSLKYSELIVIAGIVNYANKFGGWVSHIYVDNSDSVAGGREIWGLPKEIAEFSWETGNKYEKQVSITQGSRQLCTLKYNFQGLTVPVWFPFPSFGRLNEKILLFLGNCQTQIGLIESQLQIPTESPFFSLGLTEKGLSFSCKNLNLNVDAPEIVGRV